MSEIKGKHKKDSLLLYLEEGEGVVCENDSDAWAINVSWFLPEIFAIGFGKAGIGGTSLTFWYLFFLLSWLLCRG